MFTFAYYDPDYEKNQSEDPLFQIKEKIERLNVEKELKEILWDFVKCIEAKE